MTERPMPRLAGGLGDFLRSRLCGPLAGRIDALEARVAALEHHVRSQDGRRKAQTRRQDNRSTQDE